MVLLGGLLIDENYLPLPHNVKWQWHSPFTRSSPPVLWQLSARFVAATPPVLWQLSARFVAGRHIYGSDFNNLKRLNLKLQRS